MDYSFNRYSAFIAYQDVPFTYAIRHIGLALKGNKLGFDVIDRIAHLVMGIIEFIPFIGMLAAFGEKIALCRRSIKHIKLEKTDPYERGREHGEKLKNEISSVYAIVLNLKKTGYYTNKAKEFEKNIPQELKEELRGLANGSGQQYEDVLLIHTFLDASPGSFGCSVMARKYGSDSEEQRIAAANHSVQREQQDYVSESASRRNKLLRGVLKRPHQSEKLLLESNKRDTIQSIVFDLNAREIKLSANGSWAAERTFRKFTYEELFEGNSEKLGNSDHSHLIRNLDWPWPFLGQNTIVLSRKSQSGISSVNVTFPGYIGTLSGMNERGVALSQASNGYSKNTNGIPNTLFFTHLLDHSRTVEEAITTLERFEHGSSVNVIIADPTEAKSLELIGTRNQIKIVGEIK
ncbi:MAG: hypothetical protein Tsb0021_07890 [Chlamydiales bacterium]